MARTAVLGRLRWRVARVTAVREETPTARTLRIAVPGWPVHLAGQHVDVRLTAPDGYTATRAYSLAGLPESDRIELTVATVPDGEVSTYLTSRLATDAELEVRGPLGGWFVWRPEQVEAVQLVAGGSGLVPLMAMLRTHVSAGSRAPMRLLYSVRDPASVLYRRDLEEWRERPPYAVGIDVAYTRTAPDGEPTRPGRLTRKRLAAATLDPESEPTCYVCGPTGFVEHAAALLVELGHPPARIRTERFGPSGGPR